MEIQMPPSSRGASSVSATAPFAFAAGVERLVSSSPVLSARLTAMSRAVHVTVAPKTRSGKPIQSLRGRLQEIKLDDVRPDPKAMDEARKRLEELGFEVLRSGRFAITAKGSADLVAQALDVNLTVFARHTVAPARATMNFAADVSPMTTDIFLAPRGSLTVKSRISEAIDHFVFVPPPILFSSPTSDPPPLRYHHITAADIRRLLNVPSSVTGTGVKVAIVDTGFYPHPYYSRTGDFARVAVAGDAPETDNVGHGTAIALNLLAVAPEASVLGVLWSTPPQDAIELAAEHGARVITCSWGWDHEQSFPILEASIRSIIQDDGAVILVAAGNGHYAWPGSMPDVISVGGVFVGQGGLAEASDYASGFMSSLYPNRRVPDVSGLCGPAPRGVYIPMPCPPGCQMDVEYAGGAYPDGDETGSTDGWVVASGTSSATPQVAGIVALMLQRAARKGKVMNGVDICHILEATAQPVTRGRNAFGFPAVGHPNTACGYGLVNAEAAVEAV
jgi:serine protease AprX